VKADEFNALSGKVSSTRADLEKLSDRVSELVASQKGAEQTVQDLSAKVGEDSRQNREAVIELKGAVALLTGSTGELKEAVKDVTKTIQPLIGFPEATSSRFTRLWQFSLFLLALIVAIPAGVSAYVISLKSDSSSIQSDVRGMSTSLTKV